MNTSTNAKDSKIGSKIEILLFISIILLPISIVSVNALIIGGREEGYLNGAIDNVRIYNTALSEKEAMQHYYSSLYKYDLDKWGFDTNQTSLEEGIYAYYGCAKDGGGNNNCTETRVLIICKDTDKDNVCDKDEPEGCVGENEINIPANTNCISYYGFDYGTGCWKKEFKLAGTPCNLEQWYSNYSCSMDKTKVIKRYYNLTCNGAGSCNILSISGNKTEMECSTTKECSGPDSSINAEDYGCVCKQDTDGDGICNGDDKCPADNETNFQDVGHINTSCITWDGFNSLTGCHINTTYAGKVLPEPCPGAFCYSPPQVNWTCNDVGGRYIPNNGENCDQMTQKCNGDPDYSLATCAEHFNKPNEPESGVICKDYEDKCWSPYKAYHPASTGGCCGDDPGECWIDKKGNACCYSENLTKIVYLTDPDKSMGYCLLLGQNKTGNSAGPCEEGKTYCWDSNSKQCCGDDKDETWEFSTSYYIGDVLVNETCYKGNWTIVKKKKTTYFDLMSQLLKFIS